MSEQITLIDYKNLDINQKKVYNKLLFMKPCKICGLSNTKKLSIINLTCIKCQSKIIKQSRSKNKKEITNTEIYKMLKRLDKKIEKIIKMID